MTFSLLLFFLNLFLHNLGVLEEKINANFASVNISFLCLRNSKPKKMRVGGMGV